MRAEPGWGMALAVVGAQLAVGHLLVYRSLMGTPASPEGLLLYGVLALWVTAFAWHRLGLGGGLLAGFFPLALLSGGTALFLLRARRAGAGWGELALASLLLVLTAGFGVLVLSLWASRLEKKGALEDLFTP